MTVLALERYPVERRTLEGGTAIVSELVAVMREQPGLLWADAARATDDDPSFVVLAEWRTAADADAWEGGPEATAIGERLDPHLRGEVTRRRFTSSTGP